MTIYDIQNKANLIPDSDSSLKDDSNKLNFVQIRSLAAEKLIVEDRHYILKNDFSCYVDLRRSISPQLVIGFKQNLAC